MNRKQSCPQLLASLAPSASGTAYLNTGLHGPLDGGKYGGHHPIRCRILCRTTCSFCPPRLQGFETSFAVSHQFRGSCPQSLGKTSDVDEAHIPFAPFNTPNVGAVKVCHLSEFVLGDIQSFTRTTNRQTKGSLQFLVVLHRQD